MSATLSSVGVAFTQATTDGGAGRPRTPESAEKKLQALATGPHVDLWSSDEVHFQQHGSRCRMWIPPETNDPILLHALTRPSGGYFCAVRLRDGRFFFQRETDKLNAATF